MEYERGPMEFQRAEAKQNEPAEKIRPFLTRSDRCVGEVAKRRNLLGLARTLAEELNEAEELVRRF